MNPKHLMPFPSSLYQYPQQLSVTGRWVFTCKMVSKLNVSPFHRVNSPLEAPVTRRRPSGVHWRKQINSLNIQNAPHWPQCRLLPWSQTQDTSLCWWRFGQTLWLQHSLDCSTCPEEEPAERSNKDLQELIRTSLKHNHLTSSYNSEKLS